MSQKIINSRHKEYEAKCYDWNEQDLAIAGKRVWTDYCINRHHLESALEITTSGCSTRYYARLFYADNQVPVGPPIQKVQSSAQGSTGDFTIKVSDKYLQNILDNDINGEGLGSYNWLTSQPLQRLAGNGKVWMGIVVPPLPEDMSSVSRSDMENGKVKPPKWFTLKAHDVLDWVEKDGDIKDGQFSKILYKATYPKMNMDTGFIDYVDSVVLYGEDEIITFSDTGKEEYSREVNTLGFVPIVAADIGDSLISDAVQYSKKAVEISSLSMSNIRDSYFNIIQALGFKLSETGETTLNSDTLIQTPLPENKIEFVSPNSAPEVETREQIKALQEKLDNSVQQAHTNYSTSIGSGVALKEQGSHQAASVKFIMDMLLEKFRVTVYYAQKAIGLTGDVVMGVPETYQFESTSEKLEQAEVLDMLIGTAFSNESKKAINAQKLTKLFTNSELREILIKADNEAIDKAAEVPAFEDDTV